MDAEAQASIKKIVENRESRDHFVVVLGASDLEGAEISAETVTLGDPSFAGPLAGVSLGLPVYHILEPDVKEYIPEDIYNESVGIMAMVIDPQEVGERFKKIREKVAKNNPPGSE